MRKRLISMCNKLVLFYIFRDGDQAIPTIQALHYQLLRKLYNQFFYIISKYLAAAANCLQP